MLRLPYREVWALDTEFNLRPSMAYTFPKDPQPEGSIQHPVCLVARELYRGRMIEIFEGEFGSAPPFSVGPENLFIAYNATAEWLTFLAQGWPLPCRVFDPYIEYRRHICGTPWDVNIDGNKSFLKAQQHFGMPAKISADQKDDERQFILKGGPWPSPADQRRILNYCDTDVTPLFGLTERLLYADCCGPPLRSSPTGLAQAVHRGRFSLAAARMEHAAISIDNPLYDQVLASWPGIRADVITELDTLGVYRDGHFSNARFLERMDDLGIRWPRADSGLPKLDKETFEDMSVKHPQLAPFRRLRAQLAEMRIDRLQIGVDGRNRSGCRMFGSKPGRNTPSQNRYLFGLPKWVRHFLKPPPGRAVAYLDYRNQEYHIAGVLSGDTELLRMLAAADPYMAFAIMSGLAPEGATKQTHPQIRAVCKTLLLGTNYGMGATSFAVKADIPLEQAIRIHSRLKHTFSRYHQWTQEVVREARAGHWLTSVFGWRQYMDLSDVLTIKNWKMQANGAEMLRLACCLATERGVQVCGPIHDAILIEAPLPSRSDVYELAQRGDLASSFAFVCSQDSWRTGSDGIPVRTLESVRLRDVSAVSDPAYLDSTCAMRSLARAMDAPYEDVERYSRAGELNRFFVRTDRPSIQRRNMSGAVAKAHIMGRRWPELQRRNMSGAQAKLRMLARRPIDPIVPRALTAPTRDPRLLKLRLRGKRIDGGW